MKTKLFKSLALIMATILVFLSLTILPSAEGEIIGLRSKEEAEAYIEEYANDIKEEEKEYCVENVQPLESFSEEKRYVLYLLSPSGYAVYDEISGVVEEMMLGAENPYRDVKDGALYYGGPMNYILKSDEAYFLITDNIKLTEDDIAALTKLEKSTAANRQAIGKGLPPQTTTDYYMDSATYFVSMLGSDFGDNQHGTCTQVACGIMLGYYDLYVNDLFVPDAYRENDGTNEDFHAYLQTFMGTSSCGLANAAAGLNDYFSAIFFTTPTAYYETSGYNTVYTRVSNRVYNNRPTVIAMFNWYDFDCPYNHSVVAYGYRQEMNAGLMTSAAYFVHNGWYNNHTGVYAWDWFAHDLYIA